MGGEVRVVIIMMRNTLNRITGWLDENDQDTCAKMMRRIDKRRWMVAYAKRAYSLMLAATGSAVVAVIAGIAAMWMFGGNAWFVAPMVLCMLIVGGADVWLWWRYRSKKIEDRI